MEIERNADTRNIKILLAIVAGALVIVMALLSFLFSSDDIWDDIFRSGGLRNTSDAASMPFSVHFLDVGQGDCILVVSDDVRLLIDAGPRGNADEILRYLGNLNIRHLDYIIITHFDSDHIGSMPEVIRSIGADSIIMPYLTQEQMPTTQIFRQLVDTISESDATVLAAKPGDTYSLASGFMTILGPINTLKSMNEMSVVAKVDYGEVSFLFMGDAENRSERDILQKFTDLNIDVLKVGHHGSKSSTSEELLRKTTPRVAIISCGAENRYGHPSAEVIERLTDFNIEIYRTDLSGTIVLGSDGKTLVSDYSDKEAA